MKTKLNWMPLAAALLLMGAAAEAQSIKDHSAMYWVVEGNINTPTYTIIHYYNGHDELVGEERVEGKLLDITKRKNVKLLNAKLRTWGRADTVAEKTTRKAKRKI